MKKPDIVKLAAFLGVVFCAGGLGSLATSRSVNSAWYENLQKPALQPPDWLFGPVWTVLYILIGVALFLVVMAKTDRSKKNAYMFFGVQLALNTLWSVVFFGLRQPKAGVVIILALLVMIALTQVEFYKIRHSAGALLAPYLLWVCFAAYLNSTIASLN